MEEKLDKVIDAVSDIKDTLAEQKVTLAKQAVVLDEHQRRSTAAEANIALMREQIKPIEDHVTFVRGVMKTLMVILTIAGVIGTYLKIMH